MIERSLSNDELLLHLGWLRRLAVRLAGSAGDGEDLAQDAAASALEQRPGARDSVRPWLATVLRNRWRAVRRGTARREAGERELVTVQAHADPRDSLARAELHGRVVRAVLELREPYRTAVLQRFLEEEPPSSIAARLGVPVATIDSRIQRGLAELRRRLDTEYGDQRSRWAVLVLPVLPSLPLPITSPALEPQLVTTTLGVLALNTKLAALFLATVFTAALAWRFDGGLEGTADPTQVAPLAPLAPHSSTPPSTVPASVAHDRSERRGLDSVAGGSVPSPSAVPATPEAVTVRGRVLDAEGQALAGVPVRARDDEARAVSTSGGWFELESRSDRGTVVADDEDWCTVFEGVYARGSARPATLVVARAARFAGRVVEESGRPLPEAYVHREMPADFGARFGAEVEATREASTRVQLDEAGRFEFVGPAIQGTVLAAFAAGYDEARVALDSAGTAGLEIVLCRTTAGEVGVVRGRVVSPDGAPVVGARVGMGLTSVVTDRAGRFELERRRAVTTERLIAVAAGFRAGELLRPLPVDEGVGGWPDEVVLTLGSAPLRIEGRVVDRGGAPVEGAQVWLLDSERFGVVGQAPLEVEALAAGVAIPPRALLSATRLPNDDDDNHMTSRSTIGPPSAVWNYELTDAEGRFTLAGLSDRSYGLRLLDKRSGAVIDGPRVQAGARDVEIVLPSDVTVESFGGLVLGQDARPVAGVEVVWSVEARSLSARVFGGLSEVTYAHRGERTLTDEDGRFQFKDLPRQELTLTLTSDRIAPEGVLVSRDQVQRGTTTVTVQLRCRFRVEVRADSPLRASAVSIRAKALDESPLDVLLIRGESLTAYTNVALVDGRTEVLAVRSNVRQIVLLDAQQEVIAVRTVTLTPSETTLVEF